MIAIICLLVALWVGYHFLKGFQLAAYKGSVEEAFMELTRAMPLSFDQRKMLFSVQANHQDWYNIKNNGIHPRIAAVSVVNDVLWNIVDNGKANASNQSYVILGAAFDGAVSGLIESWNHLNPVEKQITLKLQESSIRQP